MHTHKKKLVLSYDADNFKKLPTEIEKNGCALKIWIIGPWLLRFACTGTALLWIMIPDEEIGIHLREVVRQNKVFILVIIVEKHE